MSDSASEMESKPSVDKPMAWYRYETLMGHRMRVYYETQAWPDLLPLYDRPAAPASAAGREEWRKVSANDATRQVAWIDRDAQYVGKFDSKGARYLLNLPQFSALPSPAPVAAEGGTVEILEIDDNGERNWR